MLKRPIVIAIATAFAGTPATADNMEELVVTASHDTRTIDVTGEVQVSPDVAQLLKRAPGANVNSNGPLTGIPQYRGLFGPRIATSLDGTELAPSGPNWMDPPLSYAVGGQLDSLDIYRGIAPVSVAQESLGGAIVARQDVGSFTGSDEFTLSGRLIGAAQSVDDSHHLNTAMIAANRNHRLKLAAMSESGDDAEFAEGDILPTEYERQRYDAGYGFRTGDHTLQLNYGYNDTGDSGTPALPMDIEYFEGDLYRLAYQFDRHNDLQLGVTLYGSELDHRMTNYLLRREPPPDLWRRNTATSDNLGAKIDTTVFDSNGTWTFGLDGFSASHDSDIDNPNSPLFFVQNFNDASRQIVGVFMQRQHTFSNAWRGELGLRYNRVEMDADTVDGTPAMMMPPATALRDSFNDADREQHDDNIDAVARAWFRSDAATEWYLGMAQKSRSPSYQERYLWLPLEATAGLADGNTYTGNIELDPEISRQIEFGIDYSNNRITLAPRIFYNDVENYILGTPSTVAPAIMFVRMMNERNGTSTPDPLQFNNVDAEIYGFDMDWALRITQRWSMSGLVNYVRGKRDDDSHDDLYRIAPPNASLRLDYSGSAWSVGMEGIAYAEQDNVSETVTEQETAGYGLVNLYGGWRPTAELTLSAGINNLFDRRYQDHLAGYNRVSNPDIPVGDRLPGYGMSLFARLVYEF